MDRAAAQAILEIEADATPEDLRVAYRRRAFATHPDRVGGDAAAFHAVCDAYQCLSDPGPRSPTEPGPASEPDQPSRVPPTDAARVLFEYLSDLASEMILNGATPEMVVSFLAREGCPESVARALERELRAGVQAEPGEPPTALGVVEPQAAAPPKAPSVAQRPASASRTWPTVGLAAAAVAVCIVGVSLVATSERTGTRSSDLTPPTVVTRPDAAADPAAAAAPPATAVPPTAVAGATSQPTPPPSAPAPARPRRSTPARPITPQPSAQRRDVASVGGTSASLDAERDALEADQRRFAALVAALESERRRIDAAEAELASASDVERFASLASQKAAYNARLELARRTEKDLQRRVRDLNAQIAAWNDRVRSGR